MIGSSHATKGLRGKGTARRDRPRTNFNKAVAAPRAQWVHRQEAFGPRPGGMNTSTGTTWAIDEAEGGRNG